jgi:hypothetical protein
MWEDSAPAEAWWARPPPPGEGGDTRPVSERGTAAFDRAAAWAAGGGCAGLVAAEYGGSPPAEPGLVRDASGLLLGLASRSFELDAARGLLQPRAQAAAAGLLRLEGRGRTVVGGVLGELCAAGSHAHRLGVFAARQRVGAGRVVAAFCGALDGFLERCRRQILDLPKEVA